MSQVIGFIGQIGAGKDFAADYLAQKYNIPVMTTSSILMDILYEQQLPATRENLIELGTALVRQHSGTYLAQRLVQKMDGVPLWIATGMRETEQINYFRQHTNHHLIAIHADDMVRFQRVQQRRRLGEATTIDEFIAAEIAENSPPRTQRLFRCIEMADEHIDNNADASMLYRKLDCLNIAIC